MQSTILAAHIGKPFLSVQSRQQVGPLHLHFDISLQARWTVLFGPSGSGKSTFLQMLAGLPPFASESVIYMGRNLASLPAHRRSIGLVQQQPALFPHKTVRQNVAFGCNSHPGCIDWIAEILTAFALNDLAHLYPATLSGGEHQRVAIARALCATPRLLLLDEVFTGMHVDQKQQLIATLRDYSHRLTMPILSVTHDVTEAFTCAEAVLRMEDGRIVGQGPPEQVLAAERSQILQQLNHVEAG